VNTAPRCTDTTVDDPDLYYNQLTASTQMPAQLVTVNVGVPFNVLASYISDGTQLPFWNPLFLSIAVTDFSLCAPFDAGIVYSNGAPLAPYLSKITSLKAPHYIDQHGYNAANNQYAFGWVFQLKNPTNVIVFGRHTFLITQANATTSTLTSYEKAAGSQLNDAGAAAAWTQALELSLVDAVMGASCLEKVYTLSKGLDPAKVKSMCYITPTPTPLPETPSPKPEPDMTTMRLQGAVIGLSVGLVIAIVGIIFLVFRMRQLSSSGTMKKPFLGEQ